MSSTTHTDSLHLPNWREVARVLTRAGVVIGFLVGLLSGGSYVIRWSWTAAQSDQKATDVAARLDAAMGVITTRFATLENNQGARFQALETKVDRVADLVARIDERVPKSPQQPVSFSRSVGQTTLPPPDESMKGSN